VQSQHQHPRTQAKRHDLPRSFQTVDAVAQPDIHQHDVGLVQARHFHRFLSAGCHCGNRDVGTVKNRLQALTCKLMVVYDEDARRCHGWTI
jgi:hypothetical protein